MYQLLGYRVGTSDKCGDYIMATFLCKLSQRDLKAGYVGSKVVELFLTTESEFFTYLKPDHVGKNFNVMLGLDKEVLALEVVK